MGYVVLTSCTNRKRVNAAPGMRARAMAPGVLAAVAECWLDRIGNAVCAVQAESLYAGRGFSEARSVAASESFYIVSAGLGVVPADLRVPAYDLTIAPGAPDNVLALVSGTMVGLAATSAGLARPDAPPVYVRKGTWAETMEATRANYLRTATAKTAEPLPTSFQPYDSGPIAGSA